MLLSKKNIFKNDKLNMTILQHMGYSAHKLWNVGNYEKRNYKKLGMKKFPDWYNQKKCNFFYKNLPSQTAQDILQLLQEGWKSYFTLYVFKRCNQTSWRYYTPYYFKTIKIVFELY